MIIKDVSTLRALLTLKGLHQQVDIANKFHVSQNSVTRWFKGKPMHRSMAERFAEFLERDAGELFINEKIEVV